MGGVLNSIAGGGSFITFPALMFVGIPPVAANATNTFASCAGYLSGVWAFWEDVQQYRRDLLRIILLSMLGGILGAWLLLQIPETTFYEAIPWLLLFATILFIYGADLNKQLSVLATRYKHSSKVGHVLLLLFLVFVCLYGGFFNAGMGIILLSYLALAGYKDINDMNGIKLVMSSSISVVAIALFVYHGKIVWAEGVSVLLGTVTGGYLAAHYSRKLPQQHVRSAVVLASIAITVYFFYEVYSRDASA